MKLVDDFKISNNKLVNILTYLLIASVILIPFDNLPYLGRILGELSYKGAVYPFIFIIIILFAITIKSKKIYFKKSKEIYFLLVYIGWIIISLIFNISSILNNTLKERSGISKLILQLMVLGFMLLIFYSTDIIIKLKTITLFDLRKYILLSLIPVLIYGTIELLNLSGIINFSKFIEKVSYLIQSYHRGTVYTKGIRTVTGEVSYFAMYVSFILPWIASYIFTEKKKKNKIFYSALTGYIILLLVFSKSRTAYGIMFIQLALFSIFMLVSRINLMNKLIIIRAIGISIVMFLILNVTLLPKIGGDSNSMTKLSVKSLVSSLTDPNNMSNVARLGLQESAMKIGKSNPIVGVGIGQYGFYAPKYLSEKALTSHEVQYWIDPKIKDSWPPAFSLYPRILAEQGFMGIMLWVVFLGYTLIKAIRVLRRKYNDVIGIALIVSFIGILISWFNADSFGQVQFWILLPFIINYNNELIGKSYNYE
ncbi:O-antigen ligase family protein [Clostridium massiliamazoniense]|uniref:O-antigen ligase family protein n=1 Tax=Clostridium massiliamazoniense TaxID=1347366 RepID=UPI0006D7FEA3|nr:O-antigen ligase family protein [Clostridium massiliamazoniense]